MHDLDRSIIATLGYYGAFSWPLTLMEVGERLIPARRLGGRNQRHAISDIVEHLAVLQKTGVVAQEYGLYALADMPAGFGARRVEQEKVWAQKWRRMLRRAWWLQAVPYVRGLFASGSLALGNMNTGSDWDVFVVAQAGRLYTARIGLVVGALLVGSLRTKRTRDARDTFCFNHYVTTDGLVIRHRSLYVAHGLAILVPLHDRKRYLERLWQANGWMEDFLPVPGEAEYVRRSVRYSRALNAVRIVAELVLDTPLGVLAERSLRAWQQRRIDRTPATHHRGGRIIADMRELEFHPRSFEATALSRYNAVLDRHGLGAWHEHDSGLTT